MSPSPTADQLAQIEQRNAEWLAETPGAPPWTERQRGEGFFQAGYDRHVLLAALQEATERVAVAYAERNLVAQLAAYFAADGDWPVWWGVDPAEPEWPVLYIEGPTGQLSWHLPKAEAIGTYPDFGGHFAPPGPEWDGHSTETKDDRIRAALAP
jgi:hypothetical protein